MVQAVFCDFYGTIVHEVAPQFHALEEQLKKTGSAKNLKEIVDYWWKLFQNKKAQCSTMYYQSQHQIAYRCMKRTIEHFGLQLDAGEMCDLMVEHWCKPVVYEDAQDFVNSMHLPVYIVADGDDVFVKNALEHCGLHPDDIITSEQARQFKPGSGMFWYALEQTGFRPSEVVYISHSLNEDVEVPESMGIRSIWMNRKDQPVPERLTAVSDLGEVKQILSSMK